MSAFFFVGSILIQSVVHLDQDRQLIVCIATGRNQLVKVTIKLSTIVKEIEFQLEEAKIVHGSA